MSDWFGWIALSCTGFMLSSIGGLGGELLDKFAGRSLEAYCRLKKNRERFGAVLDHQDASIRASEYLRMIGTVLFLISGTAAIFVGNSPPSALRLIGWAVVASAMMMLTHVWLPAAVTRFASTPLLYHTWPFWRSLSTFMHPLSAPGELVELITRRLAGKEESDDEDEEQLEDEIRTIVAAGTREGFFGPGVREMIQGVMTLHEDTVSHIMTPRGDVDAIDAAASWTEILKIVVEAGRTRFPVYQETLDNVIGVLYVKDLLPMLASGGVPEQGVDGNHAASLDRSDRAERRTVVARVPAQPQPHGDRLGRIPANGGRRHDRRRLGGNCRRNRRRVRRRRRIRD